MPMKISEQKPLRWASVKKWKDSQLEQVIEYHKSINDAIKFINGQPQPKNDEFKWLVGEFR